MSFIENIKPFWPLLFTFVLPRAIGYTQALKVAIRTRRQEPVRLSNPSRRSLYVLIASSCLWLGWTLYNWVSTVQGRGRPGYENIFQTTHSRLQIPTDVLFTRLALARNEQLSAVDEALRGKLTTPALRMLYLRFGASTLVHCPFCTGASSADSDSLSLLLYHLPTNILLPHLLHLFALALATLSFSFSPSVAGGAGNGAGAAEASKYRLRALLGALALLLVDLYTLTAYPVRVDGRGSAGIGLFWATAILRPLSLSVYDALVALTVWAAATGRLEVVSSVFGSGSASFGSGAGAGAGAGEAADAVLAARRMHQSLTAANVALKTTQAKLRAVHVVRNAVVRNARLKDTDDAYWRDVVAIQDLQGLPGHGQHTVDDIWDQVQHEEEVQAALARAFGSGTINVAQIRAEADSFVRSVTTPLDSN